MTDCSVAGLEIDFGGGGSKLLLPGSRPGSKTKFVVAKLCVNLLSEQLVAAVVLGCVADLITNITQKCVH